ncbi:MAG: hypothetical protein ABI537_11990 [Casimicrobiaceae bacterium]
MTSCVDANLLGWIVGALAGTLTDIVLLALVAASPALGRGRSVGPDRRVGLRRFLRRSLWLLLPIWCVGGAYTGREFLTCYARGGAYAAVAMIGILIALAILSAANQIGRRSVR